jgi:hypothetical protein
MICPQFRLQITLIAQLGDDIAVPIAGKNLKTSQDIGMVQLFKDIDLLEKKLL